MHINPEPRPQIPNSINYVPNQPTCVVNPVTGEQVTTYSAYLPAESDTALINDSHRDAITTDATGLRDYALQVADDLQNKPTSPEENIALPQQELQQNIGRLFMLAVLAAGDTLTDLIEMHLLKHQLAIHSLYTEYPTVRTIYQLSIVPETILEHLSKLADAGYDIAEVHAEFVQAYTLLYDIIDATRYYACVVGILAEFQDNRTDDFYILSQFGILLRSVQTVDSVLQKLRANTDGKLIFNAFEDPELAAFFAITTDSDLLNQEKVTQMNLSTLIESWWNLVLHKYLALPQIRLENHKEYARRQFAAYAQLLPELLEQYNQISAQILEYPA